MIPMIVQRNRVASAKFAHGIRLANGFVGDFSIIFAAATACNFQIRIGN
jgi:hypothetical protein